MDELTQQRIVWFAMVQGLLFMGVVPIFLQTSGVVLDPTVMWSLVGAAAVVGVASLFVPGLLPAPQLQRRLVRWAMIEAAGICGLVIVLLQGSLMVGYTVLVSATLGLIAAAPWSTEDEPTA